MRGKGVSGRDAVQDIEELLNAQESEEMEIDLLELIYRLVEKAKHIVAASVLGAVVMAIVTFFVITPKYTATSKLYVMNSSEAAINLSDLQIGTYLTSDYQEVFKNWHVHEMVIEELDLPYSYAQLSQMLQVTNPANTRVLYLQVTAKDPLEAKQIADTYARKAQEFIASTMDTKMPNLFEEALLPSAPSSPKNMLNIMVGFILGFVIACVVICAQYIMDDRVRNSEEIEKWLGLPALGIMPKQKTVASASRKAGRKER